MSIDFAQRLWYLSELAVFQAVVCLALSLIRIQWFMPMWHSLIEGVSSGDQSVAEYGVRLQCRLN
jgi:hypothetical protein